MVPLSHCFPLGLRHYLLTDTESINIWLNLDDFFFFGNVFSSMPIFWHKNYWCSGIAEAEAALLGLTHSTADMLCSAVHRSLHNTISLSVRKIIKNCLTPTREIFSWVPAAHCERKLKEQLTCREKGKKKKIEQISISYPQVKALLNAFPLDPPMLIPQLPVILL